LSGETWRTAIDPPAAVTGVALDGDGLAFSTMKESEDGEWLVLRCLNLLDRDVPGSWQLSPLTEARRSRLDEAPLEALDVQEAGVAFVAPPRGIVTILVR
jgi:hypothetical protein